MGLYYFEFTTPQIKPHKAPVKVTSDGPGGKPTALPPGVARPCFALPLRFGGGSCIARGASGGGGHTASSGQRPETNMPLLTVDKPVMVLHLRPGALVKWSVSGVCVV
jgi:hypothetical protein